MSLVARLAAMIHSIDGLILDMTVDPTLTSASAKQHRQWRALFFAFDGGVGLGHLRRLARIAEEMQGSCACLLVTGHREAADWFIPSGCEYVHIPSWDSLISERSQYWGREPFLQIGVDEAIDFRRQLIAGIVEAFRPDAIFVDHLPLGSRNELAEIVRNYDCRKYLITRGVLNETEDLDSLILGGEAGVALVENYDRILVAADSRIVDFANTYDLPAEIREKVSYTGYVSQTVTPAAIAAVRKSRGLQPDDVWVVASAGGGQTGEETILASIELARSYSKLAFDIVLGPRSGLRIESEETAFSDSARVRISRGAPNLPLLHASADLVITSGGYNSLLEAIQGRAKIVCVPLRKSERDEQRKHTAKLAQFVEIWVAPSAAELAGQFAAALSALKAGTGDRRAKLDLDGSSAISSVVLDDLSLSAETADGPN